MAGVVLFFHRVAGHSSLLSRVSFLANRTNSLARWREA